MPITLKSYDASENPEFAHLVMDILIEESEEVRSIGIDRGHVISLLKDKTKNGVFIAVDDGKLVGCYIFCLSSEWYNPSAIYATDRLVWVHPEYRGGSVFFRLVSGFEKLLKTKGIKRNKMSQTTGINTEKTAHLYEKMGYKIIGFSSVKGF